VVFSVPCQYQPDTTQNYEVGLKGGAFSGRLTFDASLYDIEWRNMQLQVADPTSGQTYYVNASRARSQGLEVSGQAELPYRFAASGWIALNDARLTADMPPNSSADAHSGDPLPFASRFSAFASLKKHFPLGPDVTGALEADLRYVGHRQDGFPAVGGGPRLDLPAYTTADLRASIECRAWEAAVFVRNLNDARGVLARSQIGFTTFATNYIQPRTLGLSISRSF
jgi:iron complex outermembrane receptor protein